MIISHHTPDYGTVEYTIDVRPDSDRMAVVVTASGTIPLDWTIGHITLADTLADTDDGPRFKSISARETRLHWEDLPVPYQLHTSIDAAVASLLAFEVDANKAEQDGKESPASRDELAQA